MTLWWLVFYLVDNLVLIIDVEPQYSGARIEGDLVTLDFVKKMMDDFKNQKCIHKRYVNNIVWWNLRYVFSRLKYYICYRYAFQIVLQTRDMLRALPSLVDIHIPDGSHFTVCGDVHGQVHSSHIHFITFWHTRKVHRSCIHFVTFSNHLSIRVCTRVLIYFAPQLSSISHPFLL